MTEEHHIAFIWLVTDQGVHRAVLNHTGAPEAVFHLAEGEKAEAVYEFCNLHGLWKKAFWYSGENAVRIMKLRGSVGSHHIQQAVAARLGIALAEAVRRQLRGSIIGCALSGVFRTGVAFFDPLLEAGLFRGVLVCIEDGGQVIVHIHQQGIPLLERAGGQCKLVFRRSS